MQFESGENASTCPCRSFCKHIMQYFIGRRLNLNASYWYCPGLCPKEPSLKQAHQSLMGVMLLKIVQRTLSSRGTQAISNSGNWTENIFLLVPFLRSTLGTLQRRKRKSLASLRWTTILQLFKCSDDNSLSKWVITQDTNGTISMPPLEDPGSWVGAGNWGMTRFTVPVPWRLIPVDNKFY